MPTLGKKDKEKAKTEAKKARQNQKADKVAARRHKKEVKDSGEQDIDAILADFAARYREPRDVTIQKF